MEFDLSLGIGLAVVIFVIAVIVSAARSKKEGETRRNSSVPPATPRPMPPRNIDMSGRVDNGRRPLPPRPGTIGLGGLHPDQFPVCPVDRRRNEFGKPQVIVWDETEKCYRCVCGRKIGTNGKILS